jgi:outer membrane protein TolC
MPPVSRSLASALALSILAPSPFAAEPTPLLERIAPSPLEAPLLDALAGEVGANPDATRVLQQTRSDLDEGGQWARWDVGPGARLSVARRSLKVQLEDLYVRALKHSSQIRVFSDLPLIRETGITEAKGAFDTQSFVSGQFERTNDPVGTTLQTGRPGRFEQDEWLLEAGLRKKLITGTEVSLTQRITRTDNNSLFFVPNPQAKATLELNIVQPLLKGAGMRYNRSLMEIARLDSEVAMNEFIRQSESHLLEICRTYWALHAARENLASKTRLIERTSKTSEEVKARAAVDAQQKQIYRAESALASRRAEVIRAEAAVRNAQDRLKTLINDPELLAEPNLDLVPADAPSSRQQSADVQEAARVALENRPEIRQAFMQLRAATIRENVAKNEVLPELNLVLRGVLGGLDGADIGTSYERQYTDGSPGWGAGFVFSIPLENHIGKARLERRRLETRQQVDQLRTTADTVLLEVKISAREVNTSWREMQAKRTAAKAFAEDITTIEARRAVEVTNPAPGVDESARTAVYLDALLDSQDRFSIAEEEANLAAANYQVALVNLQRAKGKLLAYHDVSILRGKDDRGLPVLYLEKGARLGKEAKAIKASR